MDVVGAIPPPVPPNAKEEQKIVLEEPKIKNFMSFCQNLIPSSHDIEPKSVNITLNEHLMAGGPITIQKTWKITSSAEPMFNNQTVANSSEEIYENVVNPSPQTTLMSIVRNCETPEKMTERRRKTPKIEVRQEDYKTVVKISVKETPSPEKSARDLHSPVGINITEISSGSACDSANEVTPDELVYENVNLSNRQCYENLVATSSTKIVPEECVYANLNHNFNIRDRSDKKQMAAEADYCNVNAKLDITCDQPVYENEFKFKKCSTRDWNDCDVEVKIDDAYENVESSNGFPIYVNENLYMNDKNKKIMEMKSNDFEKKTSHVELTLRNGISKEESNILRDPCDSGTSSDVDSLPTFVQAKKGNVIVTIKTLQGCETNFKKEGIGHRRAESLTSSGVGVDSEESDDENSNISCDSLNSSDPYPLSNSDDHGYHTPNSEDKTGSPVNGSMSVYENIMKDQKVENECLTRKVTDTVEIMRTIERDRQTYLQQVLEPGDFDEYETLQVFEKRTLYVKKKPQPPQPSPPKSVNMQSQEDKVDKNNQKFLPKNLLQDIRSKNVRLASTYPNGESKQETKTSVAEVVLNLESTINKNQQKTVTEVKETIPSHPSVKPPKKKGLDVEERTYEDRKLNAQSIKVNKICAMDLDADLFYKFHLSENFREDGSNDEETFAGIKDYLSREKSSAITSAKGTIRGVRNRVKAGIATFLQMQENKVRTRKTCPRLTTLPGPLPNLGSVAVGRVLMAGG
ncbi:hypothetical protein RUM44_007610 [Polyplax serrata]|uniref:Uncharacterized protein n=1 Tax=Polyplax serrata TaxID=468196 RepID=A0ABR1BA25_POLSC